MIVNGSTFSAEEAGLRTLSDLVRHYGLDPVTVAVEWNGTLPNRAQWDEIELTETDRVELIGFVGGG